MTEEEKKAIENLKSNIEYAKKCGREDTYTNQETIYIVLNLIQNQQSELEFQKDINRIEEKRHKQTEKSLKGQLQQKNKLINIMSEQLAGLTIFDVEKYEPIILGDKNEVKQYFERKVK